MRNITRAIVHCSFTPVDMDIGVHEIRHWHTTAPRHWLDIGYHYVIRRDGELEKGRNVAMVGAHAFGHNSDSIGICLVGGKGADGNADANFTRAQYRTLWRTRKSLDRLYGPLEWLGHRDVSAKDCPGFDTAAFFS